MLGDEWYSIACFCKIVKQCTEQYRESKWHTAAMYTYKTCSVFQNILRTLNQLWKNTSAPKFSLKGKPCSVTAGEKEQFLYHDSELSLLVVNSKTKSAQIKHYNWVKLLPRETSSCKATRSYLRNQGQPLRADMWSGFKTTRLTGLFLSCAEVVLNISFLQWKDCSSIIQNTEWTT